MKILAFGKDPDGKLLFEPAEEALIAKSLLAALKREISGVRASAAITDRGVKLRGEIKRRVVDAGDPREVGWSFLVAHNDPQRADIERILRPLAAYRGMPDPAVPLVFGGEQGGEWLQEAYFGLPLDGKPVPQYVLMVGEPSYLPFKLQSVLGTVANVGRVSFGLDELEQYVQKILRIENSPEPAVQRQVILFGPDEDGESDPTYFSRKYMVEPLRDHVRDKLGFEVTSLIGADATKESLVRILREANPALVYTASHGLAASARNRTIQLRYNGAICCRTDSGRIMDALFSADDVPADEPFLEGCVFFQFACFGYGTPAESDYSHWLRGIPTQYAPGDFLAALPRRLLAHPRGPIAYIGHLDTAFLHGFVDPRDPHAPQRWDTRIQPYVHAVNQLLSVQPSGLAMEHMVKRLNVANQLLIIYYDRQRRGALDVNADSTRILIDNWIFRSDAQNYMILGDPAARLRIPDV